jgi:hypothetical protein
MTFSRRRSQNNVLKTTFSRRRFNAILSDNAILNDNVNQLICFIKFFNQSFRELIILIHKNLDFLRRLCVVFVSSLCRLCVVFVSFLCRLCVVIVSLLCRHCVVSVSFYCRLCVVFVVFVSSLSFLCRLENVVSRTSSQTKCRFKRRFENVFVKYICRIYV